MPEVTLKSGGSVAVELAASEQFARRLEKVWRLRRKWAKRTKAGCYRIYDADLPDYALAIDYFAPSERIDETALGGSGSGPWVVMAEYAPPRHVDLELAETRLYDALQLTAPILGVRQEDVYLRQRQRAKGGSQYAEGRQVEMGEAARGSSVSTLELLPAGSHLTDEAGLTFEVAFDRRLDVGLFLDTRDVRALVRKLVSERKGDVRFLNLFAYTGSATCHAAAGGAAETTTLDLSRTYLDWARRNMARNGFAGPEHRFVQADALAWLDDATHLRGRFDVIYLDPPTFSNSSRMRASSFEVQRDHLWLLTRTAELLAPGGVCVFCCNLRGFAPDTAALADAGIALEDISDRTIPEDFSRNAKIHHCYLVTRDATPLPH